MNMELKPIHDQVVVVVGASSGIGRATALAFGRRGAKVIVAARNYEGLASLVEQIRNEGGQADAMAADVTQFEHMVGLADFAVQRFGRIDTWVHLAAVAVYAAFEETTHEEFEQVIRTNLLGQVYGAKAALPHLRRNRGGALIHISSVEAKRSLPYHSAYAASKHGIVGFIDAMRLELLHDGVPVSVTNIMPASIDTPFFNKARTKLGVQPKGVPPIYAPEQVAKAIIYAAEHPVRDLIVGGAGKLMVVGQAVAPKLMDTYLLSSAFKQQKTKIPKSEQAPDNLYAPIDGYNQIKGIQQKPPITQRLYQQLQGQSGATTILAGLALGAVAAGIGSWRSRQQNGNGAMHTYSPQGRRGQAMHRQETYQFSAQGMHQPERYEQEMQRQEMYGQTTS